MKKITLFIFSLVILLGCSSDNGPNDTPNDPVPPIAGFSASETDIETGSTISFTDDSQNASTYSWSFDGGNPSTSTSKNQDVTYDTAGTYSVSLKVTNVDGEDTETKTDYITVTDAEMAPEADFTASETTIIRGNNITFTDTSTNDPTSWAWEFEGGNPATSSEQNPVVVYASSGVFTVTLTATNSVGESTEAKIDFITVTVDKPEADFTASETNIISGSNITFTDTSTKDPTSWSWEFEGGNPATSEEQNPVITYNNSGIFEVTLTATNSGGSDTETKMGYILVDQQSATYTVTFQGNWTAANHPTDYPDGQDHFSPVVGMVHKQDTAIFEEGELATGGIEDMAETGNNANLHTEIDALVNSGMALSRIQDDGLPDGDSSITFTIQITEEFSFVTLVTMIAPSPDWFVAAENVGLFDGRAFVDTITVEGIAYDSGTDSGSSYNSGDSDTDPADPISRITQAPLGNGTTVDPPVAFITFMKN